MTSLSHKEFDNDERKALRALVPAVADAEARRELAGLDRHFQRWREREIDSQSLIEAIHEFHQGGARRLYGLYSYLDAADAVARGIAFGFIPPPPLPQVLSDKLAARVRRFREAAVAACEREAEEAANGH